MYLEILIVYKNVYFLGFNFNNPGENGVTAIFAKSPPKLIKRLVATNKKNTDHPKKFFSCTKWTYM